MTNYGDAPSNIALTAATVLRTTASVSASADLTLSTTPTNITGAAWTVTQDGDYLLLPVWDFEDTQPGGTTMVGNLTYDGTQTGPQAIWDYAWPSPGLRATVGTVCQKTDAVAGKVFRLQAYISGGGTAVCRMTHTKLVAIQYAS